MQRITASANAYSCTEHPAGALTLKAHLTFDSDSRVLSANLSAARHRPMLYFAVSTAISVRGGDTLGRVEALAADWPGPGIAR